MENKEINITQAMIKGNFFKKKKHKINFFFFNLKISGVLVEAPVDKYW